MKPLNLLEYEPLARAKLSAMVYEYYAGGANDEVSLRDNRASFERWRLWPRVLRAVAERDLRADVLGERWAAPIAVAPMALQRMAHPEGELAVARACAALGLPYVVSTMATCTIEEIAEAAPEGLRWFQLYAFKDRAINRDLVRRAEEAGYRALVLTVDTPLLGRREGALRTDFHIPDGLREANLRPYEQGQLADMREQGMAGQFWRTFLREDNLSWDDVEWLQANTRLPLVLKGILRPDDAVRAAEQGVAAVMVSNHGGRQLDSVPSSLDALPRIAEAVRGRTTLLMDGGIRRGTDVLKALALGARAVAVGRPVLWGLAVDGQQGVEDVLRLLLDEFDLAMALSGCHNLAEITRDLVERV
ncbi:MAG: alpha-hydroxy-acid oxidizing protein [Anaerolineae bacterium]|nr:alpha-hydroxy-acid oxidizing protein [Anaerolineae bacterium]MDW8172815.1 alpha-hydroxy acid oxidase [Anaerolineae bacterium]